jgi:Arc/MetJ-type ribon-helix-helix transcriptional regulator
MPTSVRLDPETELLLKRLARHSGRSKSEVLRDAVHRMAERTAAELEGTSVYSLIPDLVGVANQGPANLARRHKEAYQEALARKHQR